MLLVLLLSCLLAAGAEMAVRVDGRSLPGTLTLDAGRLRFVPSRAGESILAEEAITQVRFTPGEAPPFRAGWGVRVQLTDGQHLSGLLLEVERTVVRLRTAWAERLEVPRRAVASLGPNPGLVPVLDNPDLTFALQAAGQRWSQELKSAAPAGQIGLTFQEQESPSSGRWLMEVDFGREQLRLVLDGSVDVYRGEAAGLEGVARRSARTGGPHRLTIRYGPQSLALLCDDQVLWYNLERGPSTPPRQIRMSCDPEAGLPAVRGTVGFRELTVLAAVEELRRPPGDPEQDEVWLVSGDQLFGQVLQADRRGVVLQTGGGKRTLSWAKVRGCFFRHEPGRGKDTERAQVRLEFRSGLGAEVDRLEGVLTGLTAERLTLRHVLLGEVVLERGRMERLTPLFHGRRQPP